MHWAHVSGEVPAAAPDPLHVSQRLLARDLDRSLGAGGRLLEADLEVVAEIGAALRPAAPPPAAEQVAEAEGVAEVGEDVGEVGKDRRIDAAAAAATADAGVAEAIVERPLLLVGENGVGLGRFLEFLFRLAVARVAIGMMLQRQLAVGAFDLDYGRLALDAEDLVIITFAHRVALVESRRP